MADFCSKRISTVTGQVSLMPQAAVERNGQKQKETDRKGNKQTETHQNA